MKVRQLREKNLCLRESYKVRLVQGIFVKEKSQKIAILEELVLDFNLTFEVLSLI